MRQSIELPRFVRKLLYRYWFVTRGTTLGVRVAVYDALGRIFLIKHSYVTGWHLPGGGVEIGEAAHVSMERELLEEGNIILTKPAELFAVYHNKNNYIRDHVILYLARDFEQPAEPKPNREIVDHGFFKLDDLPGDVSESTMSRLREIAGAMEVSPIW